MSLDTAPSLDLRTEILRLKKERNAVILAHNYQDKAIQEIADFVGDSLGLAYKAKDTDAEVIVFCGVHFMAETAKIVNPGRIVVLPDKDAGCSLEQSCPAPALEAYLKKHADKNYYVIAYINCSGGVKALSDCICTSGNAVKIVNATPADRNILFVPDANLGSWVIEQTGRPMELWQGACYVHVEFTRDSILRIREQYPDAPVVAHPECPFAVRLLADEVCSTEKMVHYCREHPAKQFIIATESGMLHRLRRECPGKEFIPGPTEHCACADCRYMKLNTMEKLYRCLRDLQPRVEMEESIRQRAEKPILRMLEISK
jgi:quinolinate synthase